MIKREIREHPPFDIKGHNHKGEWKSEGKRSICIWESNEGQQSSSLKVELCVGPLIIEIWPLLSDKGLLREDSKKVSPTEK